MNRRAEMEHKYKEYRKKTGGKQRIVLTMPYGYPDGVEEMGGPEAVYDECIRQGITWEELLNYKELPDDVWI